MRKVLSRLLPGLIFFLLLLPDASAQPTLSFDLKKPKKYEDRQLGSERTAEKKFNFPRRVYQNTVTHYNWHFNADNRLNQVLERAKAFHEDDFSQLLPFYNYSLEITQRDSMELDSVIYKANAGILIHDLRNAWIDNLYMLLGKAYFFRNELDSAYLTFQYINYTYAPKEKDGYDRPIGSNATEGGSAFSISTKENNSVLKKAVSSPPSRNESFIWQIKTFLEKDELIDAAVLIQTLRKDPEFPSRLHTDLHEVEAYYYYKRQNYDSAAHYLTLALDNAGDRYELSRWEYLIGQMYELSGKPGLAGEFFDRAIGHSLDPVLEVYARLNSIRQNKQDEAAIQRNIEELAKMGRRDRYSRYRDIIYITAAQMELERNNLDGARFFLMKAAAASNGEASNNLRSRAYLQLGDLSFYQKKYLDAKSFYDSVSTDDPAIADPVAFQSRLATLTTIAVNTYVIRRQDSLVHLAAMPEAEREVILRKHLRQLRKAQGLQEEEVASAKRNPAIRQEQNTAPVDLFNNNAKGEWYFHNPELKSKGFSAFVAKWGTRPNVDNWRRMSVVNQAAPDLQQTQGDVQTVSGLPVGPINYESLLAQLPTTPEQMAVINDSIENAMADIGKALFNGLEDFDQVIQTLDSFPDVYPQSERLPEVLYFLYVSHHKLGHASRAKQLLEIMQNRFAGNPMERQMTVSVLGKNAIDDKKEMTRKYEQIYNLFIEGNFEEALRQKKLADEIYGQNYWTPQLLYIQSIYHIRQRQDQEAKNLLASMIELFPESPMMPKAQNLLDVLNRRREIEEYLTKLQIQRPAEDTLQLITQQVIEKPQPQDPLGDTSQRQPVTVQTSPPVPLNNPAPVNTQLPVRVPEATTPANPPVVAQKTPQQPQPPVLRYDSSKIQPGVQQPPVSKRDTVASAAPVKTQPQQQQNPITVRLDTAMGNKTVEIPRTYSHNPTLPHYVIMVTDKVDPVYITESRNAFNRYNQPRYPGLTTANQLFITNTNMLVISGFPGAAEAQQYAAEVKKVARTQIIPWLPVAKYYFITISSSNYELLMQAKTLAEYRQFEAQFFKE